MALGNGGALGIGSIKVGRSENLLKSATTTNVKGALSESYTLLSRRQLKKFKSPLRLLLYVHGIGAISLSLPTS